MVSEKHQVLMRHFSKPKFFPARGFLKGPWKKCWLEKRFWLDSPGGGGPGGVHLAGSWTPPKRQKVQNQPEFGGDRPKTTQTHDFGPCSTPFSKFRHFFVLKVFWPNFISAETPGGNHSLAGSCWFGKKVLLSGLHSPLGRVPSGLRIPPVAFSKKKRKNNKKYKSVEIDKILPKSEKR